LGKGTDGNQLFVSKEFKALVGHLMSSADEGEVVGFEEVVDHIAAETDSHASLVFSPTLVKIGWISP
jgi:hypothetical protein